MGLDKKMASPLALGDLRVLELRGSRTQYCGKLLADLGADVIKVEPPGGDSSRALGPFDQGQMNRERSLHFYYFNTNKRSIVLDIESAEGLKLFRKLAATVDVVLESFEPGYLDDLGIGYDALKKDNPGLVFASITGFGQSGPHAHYKAPDIVPVAMSGMMFLAGYPEDAPNRPYGDQGDYCAGIWGAIGILSALNSRFQTKKGQQIDVSVQEALSLNQETAMQTWDLCQDLRGRTGAGRMIPAFKSLEFPGFGTYECRDGHIMAMMAILAGGGWQAVVEWMDESAMAEELTSEAWKPFIVELGLRELVVKLGDMNETERAAIVTKLAQIDEVLKKFFLSMDKLDLYEQAQARNLVVAPVNSPKDLLESPQLNARGYFSEVMHPELNREITYPGAPYQLSLTPAGIRTPAPLIAQHNTAVYCDLLGLSEDSLSSLREKGVI